MQIRHFRRFRQNGPFSAGDKNTVYQKHGLCAPDSAMIHKIRADFGQGMRRATFQFSESGGSVNGPNLFTELPFLWKSLPDPGFTELPPPFSLKTPFFQWKVLRRIPFPKIGSDKSSHAVGMVFKELR